MKRGVHVQVPVRGHLRNGYIYEIKEGSSFSKCQPIHTILSEEELIPPDLFDLALWMSKYYFAPLRQVLKIMLPASIRHNMSPKQQYYVMRAQTKEHLREVCKTLQESQPSQARVLEVMLNAKKGMLLTELLEKAEASRSPVDTLVNKGLLVIDVVRLYRSPLINEDYFKSLPKQLSQEQKKALDTICTSIQQRIFQTHLLFGITGSGKTEVYLQAIEKALENNLGTIMLVPEIALTLQTIERFKSRFEENIAILHHRLSQGERLDEWQRIRSGEAKIVIGARSALFSPIQNLGLIIVDEEHDGAYKQNEESPCYHARDVAVMRGKLSHCTVILGSATPSLESYYNATAGKYQLNLLSHRHNAKLPSVTLVDMKKEYEKHKGFTSFSDVLIEKIQQKVSQGEQVICFLNRRGYHTSLVCRGCGHTFKCSHCDVSLTFHKGENHLSCHLCDFKLIPPPTRCPQCKEDKTLKYKGIGTEQVEKALHAVLPQVRTLRIDTDTTKHKGSYKELFRAFSTGKADVLIGTQMIAKGLHFPSVTLVAILNCDSALNIPDFRASESVFQLITQVAGRAGRGQLPGEVIIQTLLTENSTIQLASKQDYPQFYQSEIALRKLFSYPPFSHFVKLTFSGQDAILTQQYGMLLRSKLINELNQNYAIHPLIPSGHAKVKDFFRFQFLIRGPAIYPINEHLEKVLERSPPPSKIYLDIDIDPLSTFF